MEKDFDFANVGRKMPYRVPEGFFGQMEATLMDEVKGNRKKAGVMKYVLTSLVAFAAAIALFVVIQKNILGDRENMGSFESVEIAYGNLTNEDQEYLMQVYEDDLFLNDYNNTNE